MPVTPGRRKDKNGENLRGCGMDDAGRDHLMQDRPGRRRDAPPDLKTKGIAEIGCRTFKLG